MNFDDVLVKVEMVDEEYDCNGLFQFNFSVMVGIKIEFLELNESYGVFIEFQVLINSNLGIFLGNFVILFLFIMNRVQLDNYIMNVVDVFIKK